MYRTEKPSGGFNELFVLSVFVMPSFLFEFFFYKMECLFRRCFQAIPKPMGLPDVFAEISLA